jgi:hypothetical protein
MSFDEVIASVLIVGIVCFTIGLIAGIWLLKK